MRKLMVLAVLGIAVAAVLVFWATPQGSQANGSPPEWDVTGTWTGCSGLVGNCAYPFSMTLSQDSTGVVTGTIVYAGITGAITGHVSGSGFLFLRTDTAPPSGYTATCDNCVIASNGLSFSGTGVDSPGRAVEWDAQGVARHLPTMSIDDCSPGTYAGWVLIWTGFVSAVGPGSNTPVVVSPSLAAGSTYRIEASGTYYAGGASTFDIEADAEYSQDTYERVNGLPWNDFVRNYESYGEGLLELKVDGGFVEWSAFSSDHRYTLDLAGTGDPVTFDLQIYDIFAPNNTGGLCAAIYQPDYSFVWLPPISLDDWTLNANATLPIKFQLDDPDTGAIICTDVNPELTVDSTLQDLRFDSDGGCYYIANFRPSSSGQYQAAVTLNGEQLGSIDFDVREAGTPNGRGRSDG